jgi:hypothetical protein
MRESASVCVHVCELGSVCVCECVCVRARACVSACLRESVCARAFARARVCVSARMEQLDSHRTDFYEILYFNIFLNSVEKIQVSLKYDEKNG